MIISDSQELAQWTESLLSRLDGVEVWRIVIVEIHPNQDEELKRARRVGRPRTGNAKQLIAIRMDPRLLARLRRLAAKQSKPYQTLIHELLERAANT